jgi:hypothetical protein
MLPTATVFGTLASSLQLVVSIPVGKIHAGEE